MQAVAPAKDPITQRDRKIIATITEHAPEQIRTIWIEGGITVWVQLLVNCDRNEVKLSLRSLLTNQPDMM